MKLFENDNNCRFIKGIKGVENIYTQHEPHIKQIVELLTKGKLPEQNYGYISADGLMWVDFSFP